MNVLVIDGQGGQLGSQLIRALRNRREGLTIFAVGTNATAAAAMMKAGADTAAAGENPVLVACRKADVIIGPIGIVIADSLLGEVTPAMAVAVGQSDAVKLLLPVSHCNNQVVGVANDNIGVLLESMMTQLHGILNP